MADYQPKRGRPSDYSAQVAMSVCDRLAEGENLRAICSDAGMPGRATVFRWIAQVRDFSAFNLKSRSKQPNDGVLRRRVYAAP